MNTKKGKKLSRQMETLSPELRAYLYQQLSEFQPFFLPDSNVGVTVSIEDAESAEPIYVVQMVITGGGTFVEAVARHTDVYQAASTAKRDLLNHLYEIQNHLASMVVGEADRSSRPPYLH